MFFGFFVKPRNEIVWPDFEFFLVSVFFHGIGG